MKSFAPIVLFVYNRPFHTQKVVEALQKNKEAIHSDLFVFSDASKNEEANENVEQVRNYIKTVNGFKAITIKEQTQNQGLAKSIIDGVTEVVNKYGKIIVLEDDIETSPYFLKFMNDALNFYENEKKVWNITGFQFPISYQELPNAFFSYFSSCWSWGTWIDRWRSYDKNPDKYISLLSKKERYKFDYYGSAQRYSQIIGNKTGKINTWAIFWYAEMFINKGLCLFPAEPLAKNIGMDGSGIHCGSTSIYDCNVCKVELEIDFNKIPIEENRLAIELICRFNRKQKQNIINRIVQKGCRKMMKLKKLGINWFISLKNKIQMNCRIK